MPVSCATGGHVRKMRLCARSRWVGDIGYEARAKAEADHAVQAIIRLSKDYAASGVDYFVALTTIALALRLDPELPKRIKSVVVWVERSRAQGNTPISANLIRL